MLLKQVLQVAGADGEVILRTGARETDILLQIVIAATSGALYGVKSGTVGIGRRLERQRRLGRRLRLWWDAPAARCVLRHLRGSVPAAADYLATQPVLPVPDSLTQRVAPAPPAWSV